jgi:hypothetical protein
VSRSAAFWFTHQANPNTIAFNLAPLENVFGFVTRKTYN